MNSGVRCAETTRDLVGHAELAQHVHGGAHHRVIVAAAHDDADQRPSLRLLLRLRVHGPIIRLQRRQRGCQLVERGQPHRRCEAPQPARCRNRQKTESNARLERTKPNQDLEGVSIVKLRGRSLAGAVRKTRRLIAGVFSRNGHLPLQATLLQSNRTRWLDVGSGGGADPGFELMEVGPYRGTTPIDQNRYHNMDIVSATAEQLDALGRFDLIRMQHVFEHFTFEEGGMVLEKCHRLLNPGGQLLITVPDLSRFVTEI